MYKGLYVMNGILGHHQNCYSSFPLQFIPALKISNVITDKFLLHFLNFLLLIILPKCIHIETYI